MIRPLHPRRRPRWSRRAPQRRRPIRPASEQPATGRFIDRDISWRCGGATAPERPASRPLVLCQALAKQAGRIGSFSVNGRSLAADQLERCNASGQGRQAGRTGQTLIDPGAATPLDTGGPTFSRLHNAATTPHLVRVLRQYELVEKVRSYDPDADEGLINRAYVFSMKAHGTQLRASGDPYFSPPDRGRRDPHRPQARRLDHRHRDPPRHDRGHARHPDEIEKLFGKTSPGWSTG